MKESFDRALVILGPTASGKTALALFVASKIPCEIISHDSALIYKGMKKHYGVKTAICVAIVAVILSAICIFMLARTPMPL